MPIAKRLVAAGAAATVALGTLGVTGAGAAAPPYTPNDNQDWIRIGGSDTTYNVMVKLGDLYNNAPGCTAISPAGGPAQLDGKCADGDLITPGKQITYELDGSGTAYNPSAPDGVTGGNHDHDMAFNAYPVGSGNGLSQLTNRGTAGFQVIDIARSSRARRGSDNANLRFFAFAIDALSWTRWSPGGVGPSSTVNDLSSTQVSRLFNGCSANATNPQIDQVANGGNGNGNADWGDIGGTTGAPIVVWSAQSGSGTRQAFDTLLGSGANSTNCVPDQFKDGSQANGERIIFENDSTPIVAPGLTNCPEVTTYTTANSLPAPANCSSYSLFFFSYGRWQQALAGGSQGPGGYFGTIDGVTANPTTIGNFASGGTPAFPYSRYLYNVVRNSFGTGDASNAVRNFTAGLGFLCKPASAHLISPWSKNNYRVDIENVISDDGFVPIPFGPTGLGLADSHCRAS